MNRIFNICLLIIGLINISFVSKGQTTHDEAAIKQSIVVFFDGLAKLDETMMRGELTKDFQLLEDGLVWNADSLVDILKKIDRTKFTRANRFDFINVQQRGEVAWVSYFNYADITSGERKFKLKWLESAVLVKEAHQWRISFMHSTDIR
jgi:hypothetical protein